MNLFIGIGKIVDVLPNDKVLRFDFSIKQKRACIIPCVLLNPDDEAQDLIKHLCASKQTVLLVGKLSSYEFEKNGQTIRKLDVVTFANSIEIV